jgi:serine/threonine protein kinase
MLRELKHPKLPEFEDYFEENQRHYMVMEYIDGEDFVSSYENNMDYWSLQVVLKLAIELCSMFEYLHSQNPPVIFKDLKPQNIMIDKSGELRLIDFGISKYYGSKTMPAARAVSANFSSPEQYTSIGTDMRSDIYSLGATLYYMFTGDKPLDSVKRMINPGEFKKPGTLNPSVTEELEAIILKAMELKKEKRYQNISEMKKDLENFSHSRKAVKTSAIPVTIPVSFTEISEDKPTYPEDKSNHYVIKFDPEDASASDKDKKKRKISGKIRSLLPAIILFMIFLILSIIQIFGNK